MLGLLAGAITTHARCHIEVDRERDIRFEFRDTCEHLKMRFRCFGKQN